MFPRIRVQENVLHIPTSSLETTVSSKIGFQERYQFIIICSDDFLTIRGDEIYFRLFTLLNLALSLLQVTLFYTMPAY